MRLRVQNAARRVALALIVFYCISCLRIFLPSALRRASVVHLARLAVVWQRFPVHLADDMPGNESVPVTVNRDHLMTFLQKTWIGNATLAGKSVEKHFRLGMSSLERQQMLLTFQTFVEACNWAGLTYFLCGGSLLGSYRHHGFIPWDDDVDVIMNASDWKKVRHVLSRVPGFELFAPSSVQWKFYLHNLPAIPKKPFKWPNIDIFFFSEDSTHIWGLTAEVKGHIYAKKSLVFPLQLRPFENFQAAVPCNSEEIVQQLFGVGSCVSLAYNHKTSSWGTGVSRRPCKELYDTFPFVFRSPHASGGVTEILKVGDQILNNWTLPSFCVDQ